MNKIYFDGNGIGDEKAFAKFESIKSQCVLVDADETIQIGSSIRPCDIYEVPASVAELLTFEEDMGVDSAATNRVQYIPAVGMADTSEVRLYF